MSMHACAHAHRWPLARLQMHMHAHMHTHATCTHMHAAAWIAADCRAFLLREFGPAVARRFDGFAHNAHRADLWRCVCARLLIVCHDAPTPTSPSHGVVSYAVLYLRGGVYLDIKTKLARPLSHSFPTRPTAAAASSEAPPTW